MVSEKLALALAAVTLATGCLPGDTRPTPERLYVTVEPSQGLGSGITTADGWQITFDRLVSAVGNIDFEWDDASCNTYAEAHYDRLFDFTVAGREKVGTAWGLGTCRVEFRLRDPSYDALLGPGATESDVAFMRREATDRFATDERASVLAIGAGARGGVTKRFDWVFRRSYELTNCQTEGGDGYVTTVELTESAESELRLEARGEELFRAFADDRADLVFQPIADADADGDGDVTLDELSKAPHPGTGAGGVPLDEETTASQSLEHLVYEELLPRLLRVAGAGPCAAELRDRR